MKSTFKIKSSQGTDHHAFSRTIIKEQQHIQKQQMISMIEDNTMMMKSPSPKIFFTSWSTILDLLCAHKWTRAELSKRRF
jgi:hypothetical protein